MRGTLGNRMSKKLKEYGISQRLLATLTHTTEVSVSRYVNDKRIPKADVLYRIACALHTTTDYLLGLTTSEQTNEEWIKSLDTEGLVDYLYEVHKGGASVERQPWIEKHKERIKMQIRGWLKEKHK